MLFASLLQEAEMTPPFCWCMLICKSCCIIQFQQEMYSGFVFTEIFQVKKDGLSLKGIYVEFVFFAIPSISNSCHLICASPAFQSYIRKKKEDQEVEV